MTDQQHLKLLGYLKDLGAFIAGALLPLAMSPTDFWPLALLSPGLLFWLTLDSNRRHTMWRFYLFNVGMFAIGVSWIFVSINVYGGASYLLAGFLVSLFVLAYSLICLPQAWLYSTWLRSTPVTAAAAFIGLWVLQEWLRGWFLTGFPWLFLGYGVIETVLVGLAPLTGVFGISLVVCAISVFVVLFLLRRKPVFLLVPIVVVAISVLSQMAPTSSASKTISVSLIQGNVDQHVKWLPANRVPILNQYLDASAAEWGRDLVIWPEAAITLFKSGNEELLLDLDEKISGTGSTLVTGIPDLDEAGGFQNTVLALGRGSGHYIKRRLVPFGEYVPLESVLRGLIQFFDLPMSRNEPGPWHQQALTAGDITLSTSICYEVVYPELVRQSTIDADLLVTVSNDTWFGSSIGPWQHLQMARMRALENGRSMVRATNNGLTVLLDHRGQIISSLPQFEQGVLRGEVEIHEGRTLFNRLGSYPTLCLSFLLILVGVFLARRQAEIHGDTSD